MNFKSILTTILIAFTALNVYADITLPAKCEIKKPKVLSTPLIQQKTIDSFLKKGRSGDWGQSDAKNDYWVVYSDRDGNVTYREPNMKSPKHTTLKMNDAVRIAKIQNGYALVYEEELHPSFPQISRAKSLGWIPMDHLLLWGSCPTNEIGIYQKALPIINVDKYDKSKEKELGKYYHNPEDKSGVQQLESGVNFYFIMKEGPNNLVLLAREAKMSGKTSRVLLGWVNPVCFVNWNQRVCLEPNWDLEAGTYFEEHKVSIPVYNDKESKEKICEMPAGRKNDYGRETTQYRMFGDEMRYPVLASGNEDRSIYKVTAFVDPSGRGHITRSGNGGGGQKKKEDALNDISNINLLIVIDGTSSMKEFYPAVKQQILNANAFFAAQSNSNKVRVGIVIYRDYPDGEFVTEYQELVSANDKRLQEFLEHGGKYGVKSVANSATEAMFQGINLALDRKTMGYNERQSNLMFIIGDCGNALDDNRLTEDQLIHKIHENRVEISAFQVYNAPSQAYKLFTEQTSNLIMKSLASMYKDQKNEVSRWAEVQNGYEYKVKATNGMVKLYIGNMRYADNGEKMNISKLLELMQDSFVQFSNAVDIKKEEILGYGNWVGMLSDESVTQHTAAARAHEEFYRNQFGDAMWERMKKEGMLTAKEGYTPIHDKDSSQDFWKPVIYISNDELNELVAKFSPVANAVDSEDRMPYVEAMKQVAQTIAGNNDVSTMTDKEIRALIAGLDAQSAAMQSGKTLGQILDPKIVKPAEFKAMLQEFKAKFNTFSNIQTSGYKFSAERNGTRWYWIPVEDLP